MTQPDPRQQVRDLIAIRLHAAECGCADYRRDDSDADDPLYTHMADAVMELFPDEGGVERLIAFRNAKVAEANELAQRLKRVRAAAVEARYAVGSMDALELLGILGEPHPAESRPVIDLDLLTTSAEHAESA